MGRVYGARSLLPGVGAAETLALAFTLMILVATTGVHGADPDPLVDIPTLAPESRFVLRNLLANGDVTRDSGGIRAAVSTTNLPITLSQGIAYVRFQMVPCGVNLPHTHPRATEILTLISGGPLQVGFVDTSGTKHINLMYPGDVTVFPRGLVHYEINVGNETADYLSALNSQNPGTLTASLALFQVPARALATSLNVSLHTVAQLASTLFPYGGSLKRTTASGCVPGRDITTLF